MLAAPLYVIPAKAGIQKVATSCCLDARWGNDTGADTKRLWVPACAGMTQGVGAKKLGFLVT